MIPIHRVPAAALVLLLLALPGCSSSGPSAPADLLMAIADDQVAPALLIPRDDLRGWPFDPWTFVAHEIQGDTLFLEVRYGGGCREHRFALLIDPAFMESFPVQVAARLAHDADGDPCRALLTRTLRFDLSPLREHFEASYGPGRGTVVMGLGGQRITYYLLRQVPQRPAPPPGPPESSMPPIRPLLPVLLLVGSLASPAMGQTTWSIGLGAGTGTTRVALLDGDVARPLSDRVSLEASAHLVPSWVTCEAAWPDSFSCGFGGWGADLGPRIRLLDPGWASWSAVASVGVFRRTGDGFGDRTSLQWSAGLRAWVPVGDRVALRADLRRRWVHDRLHRELIGDGVGFTTLSLGVGLGR